LSVAIAEALIDRHTDARQFGILGEPRVNARKLNLTWRSTKRSREVENTKRPLRPRDRPP
jgi:hypothetical protein